jgi:hypothetical protein
MYLPDITAKEILEKILDKEAQLTSMSAAMGASEKKTTTPGVVVREIVERADDEAEHDHGEEDVIMPFELPCLSDVLIRTP